MILWESREVLLQVKYVFIEQYWKVISGVLFAALALGYETNILKITCGLLYLTEPDDIVNTSQVVKSRCAYWPRSAQ